MNPNQPHFELRRIYADGQQESETIELYKLVDVVRQGHTLKTARRGFLGVSVLSVGALLAACEVKPPLITPAARPRSATSSAADTPAPTPTSSSTATPSPTLTPLPRPIGQVKPPGLNLRQGPGTEYPVILGFRPGDTFRLIARHATLAWVEVRTDADQTGWVYAPLLILEPGFDINSLPINEEIPPTPVPPAATATPPPTPPPTSPPPAPPPPSSPGGVICTCNQVCICIPVYR